ncbi:MAG: KH domain-containing protein [Candidatus Shapirobacteria bacterium]|jgi:predicted RNA-binding protein YlqC (UPF0109 family)
MATIEETLEFILHSIVPAESVNLTVEKNDVFTQFTITAQPEIVGQIIGKDGRIIKSIKTLLGLSYPNEKFSLDIKS